MNRLTKGALAALATMSIAAVGCQEQGADDLDTLPSMDMTMPSQSADGMTDGSMDADESDEASPSES